MIIYLWLVLCGFLVISNERLLASVRLLRWSSLVIAIASMGIDSFLLITMGEPTFGTGLFVLMVGLRVLMSWCLVLVFLGFSIQHLNLSTPLLIYANEGVLPFYILHQTVLLSVGYFVVQWSVPDIIKWAVILLASFAIIMAFYEYLVRRFNVMRFLFGMKPITRRPIIQAIEPKVEEAARVG